MTIVAFVVLAVVIVGGWIAVAAVIATRIEQAEMVQRSTFLRDPSRRGDRDAVLRAELDRMEPDQ